MAESLVFQRQFTAVNINDQISVVLNNPTLTELSQPSRYLHWKQTKNNILIIQSQQRFSWIETLLDLLSCSLLRFNTDVFGCLIDDVNFEREFDIILKETMVMPQNPVSGVPRPFNQSKKFLKTLQASKPSSQPQLEPQNDVSIEDKLAKLKQRAKGKQVQKSNTVNSKTQHSKGGKQILDYSAPEAEETANIDTPKLMGDALGQIREGYYDALELDAPRKIEKQSIFTIFSKILEGKPLSPEKIAPVMNKMKEHLISKNVAQGTASALCNLVSKELVNQKLGSLESLDRLVRKEMHTALMKVLMPDTSINIINEIEQKKNNKDVYSVVFVGVNGVGKSTNLSKLCFWLLQNRVSVLVAACDTFRSGAVEQLKVHVKNLKSLVNAKIDLYDAGYGKDPATIAQKALEYSKNEGYDVVLIDTAGRMQDNLLLMRALSKLVTVVNPDKIIFVGEALVGNEALNQLGKFNECLSDFGGLSSANRSVANKIDGIILSKFDTVDDKVGAAVSMSHISGKPIIFVGTGQTYTDLRKLNVEHVVDCLLK